MSATDLAPYDDLVAAGRVREAIDGLTRLCRQSDLPEAERRLIEIRHHGGSHQPPPQGPADWPAPVPDLFPGIDLPEIDAQELSAELLGSALAHHGCLKIRRLLQSPHIEIIRDDIDRALEMGLTRIEQKDPSLSDPWFKPYNPPGFDGHNGRVWALQSGTVSIKDSPRTALHLFDALAECGVVPVIAEYFGEEAMATGTKTIVRRTPPDSPFEWHQDGQFLGDDIRTVNTWIPLTSCGADSPGLALIPTRFDTIFATGGDEIVFDWTVTDADIVEIAGDRPVLYPDFEPGDALLFDDWLLHATGTRPGMTETRYGIESWFFASSHRVDKWIPLTV